MTTDLARRREEIGDLVHRSTLAIRRRRWRKAFALNTRALEKVDELVDGDPGDPRHRAVRGGLLYDRALLREELGDGWWRSRGAAAAVDDAWSAVEDYLALDPTGGDHGRVLPLLAAARGRDHDQVAERIALSADARARYARLAARYHGAPVAEEVRFHGVGALNSYGELLKGGTRYGADDLDRVSAQVLRGLATVGLLG